MPSSTPSVPPPILLQVSELSERMQRPNLVLVDLRTAELYSQGHLPGAQRLDYASIVRQNPPIGGLLPSPAEFNLQLQRLGVENDSHIVAYDGEGGAAAGRLIWTLHAFGFHQVQLLDGGISAWIADGNILSTEPHTTAPSQIALSLTGDAIVDADALMQQLKDDPPTLIDSRTIEEFTGESVRANHGGRIPGAVHFEWTDAIDTNNAGRLLPEQTLHNMLNERGVDPSKPVVVYCQTHHRSSLSYVMMLHLGYTNVTALEGAWSNWGNRDDTPKQIGMT